MQITKHLVALHPGQLTEFIARGPKYFCLFIVCYQVGDLYSQNVSLFSRARVVFLKSCVTQGSQFETLADLAAVLVS